MTRNRLLYVTLRLVAALLPHLPLPVVYAVALAAADLAYLVVRPARDAASANLAVVLQRRPGDPAVRREVRRSFRTDALNWVDTLRIASLSPAQIVDMVDVHGWEEVESAMLQGHGLIVVSLHLGNYDLVGQYFAARGYHVTIPVERMEPPELFDFLLSTRRSQGIEVVPIDSAPRAMLKALRSGAIVAVAGDRNVAGRTLTVPFFGRDTALPSSHVALARRTGTPVVIAYGVRKPGAKFEGFVVPVPLARSDDADLDERVNTERIALELERIIRTYPGQWLVFSPQWPAAAPPSAARIGA